MNGATVEENQIIDIYHTNFVLLNGFDQELHNDDSLRQRKFHERMTLLSSVLTLSITFHYFHVKSLTDCQQTGL